MHANELLRTIVNKLHHASEAERDELLDAVDTAFPKPEADAPDDAPAAAPAGTPAGPTPKDK